MTEKKVANYAILGQLGKGGMGVVYEATDMRLGRTVALKFLPTESASTQAEQQRFVREAMTASSLDHPNICTIYEVGNSEDGDMFIAMARYEGLTFRALIRQGPQSIERAVELTKQTAEGLSKAHRNGVIHRDIKPGNLMLTTDGIVKILDFGLARIGMNSDLTATGQILGTIKYMSPEQLKGTGVDHRTDIWALGVVFYELLTGRKPFDGDAGEVMSALMSRDPEPVRRLRKDAPIEVADIIGKAMARDLEFRYPNIDEMLEDLKRCQASGSVSKSENVPLTGEFARQASDSETAAFSTDSLATKISSLAVLPFENLSGDPENTYFSDGLTDDLIHALSVQEELQVISRNSVYEFKEKSLGLSQVRQILGADTVIEGSVRRSGSRVRVVARLVNAIDGQQIWSEKYDREMGDVFEMQDEIVGMIKDRLEIEMEPQSGVQHRRAVYQGDMEVYELYLKGRHFWHRKVFDKSLECYEEAIAKDPDFALAHAGLANHYANLGVYGGVDPKEVWPKVRNSVLRAMELDRNLPEAHIALGFLRTFEDWDWKAAGRAFAEAVRLAPGSADASLSMVMHLYQTGRFEQARHKLKQAKKLDPLSPLIQGFELGGYVYAGEFEKAIEVGTNALETGDSFDIRLFRAMALQGDGRFDEAVKEFSHLYELTGGGAMVGGFLGGCYAAAGDDDNARKILAKLQSADESVYVPNTSLAITYAAMGEMDEAFDYMSKAAGARDALLCYAKVLPAFHPFKSDPRFNEILERIGLLGADKSGFHASSD